MPPLEAFNKVIAEALVEDAADRDATAALLPPELIRTAVIVARQSLVVCGTPALPLAFGPEVRVLEAAADGSRAAAGAALARLHGPAHAIVRGERTLLNLLARLSGIATFTRRHVDASPAGSRVRLLDTRKTTPGLRLLEKYAVRCGGAENHRMTLADAVFVKDNHIAAAGGLDALLDGRALPPELPLIIEADTLEDVRAALRYSPSRILLDNMTDAQIVEAVRIAGGRCELEVSGGVTLDRIPALSRLGVDFISLGALTHSAPSVDISLEIVS